MRSVEFPGRLVTSNLALHFQKATRQYRYEDLVNLSMHKKWSDFFKFV